VTKVYAFDVDHTLEVSEGPVKLNDLITLHKEGNILGLCGNWALLVNRVTNWHLVISFLGPMNALKEDFLRQISTYVPADEYVMVGNDPGAFARKFPGQGCSDDKGAAERAGWRYIAEEDFAKGAR
jgi:hypothetical protein